MAAPNQNSGVGAPIIALDDTGLNTLRRQSAAASEPLPPPLPLNAIASFETDAPVSESIMLEEGGGGRPNRSMLIVLGLVLLGLAFLHFTGENEDPLENFSAFFQDMIASEGELTVATAPVPLPEPAKEVIPEGDVPGFSANVVPNPYWMLPNELEKGERAKETVTPEDNQLYTNGLNHRYPYQRYRIAKEVRATKRLGTAGFLAKASAEPKFWTRMEGGLGLIEQGYALDIAATERLIGDARPSLVYNYMQRFVKKPSPADIYFMKQAIRLVDARTRLHILKILSRDQSRHELYFAAATYDPSETVTNWMAETFGDNGVSPEILRQYQGMALEDIMKRGQTAPRQLETAAQTGPISVRAEEIKIDGDVVEDVAVFSEMEAEEVLDAKEVFTNEQQSDDGFGELINLRGGEPAAR